MSMIAHVEEQKTGEAAMGTVTLGMLTFLGSEAVFFGCLIASYLYLRMKLGVWPPAGMPQLEALFPALNTAILVASGATMHWAHKAIEKGKQSNLKAGIIATILLGSAFLGGQAYEYGRLRFSLSSGIMGSTFFVLTGFHGAHVLGGLLFLLLIVVRAFFGHYSLERHAVVEAGALYWHFVDAVWIVLFTVLYLV